ncbi:MAG: ankyrin repeat domain-containing protein [Candidatus Babeliales bacterium]
MKKTMFIFIVLIGLITSSIHSYEGIWPYNEDKVAMEIILASDINEQDSTGDTLLHRTVTFNDSLHTKILLKYNADPNIQNNEGKTPLHTFVQSLNTNPDQNIKLLLEAGANLNTQDNNGNTVLHRAAMVDNTTIIPQIIFEGQLRGISVDTLLNQKNNANKTAIECGRSELTKIVLTNRTNILTLLLAKIAKKHFSKNSENIFLSLMNREIGKNDK